MSELAAARENERLVRHELLKTQDLLRMEQAKTKKLSIQVLTRILMNTDH